MNKIDNEQMEIINKKLSEEYNKFKTYEDYNAKLYDEYNITDDKVGKEYYLNYQNIYHKYYINSINETLSKGLKYLSHDDYAKKLRELFIQDEEDEYVIFMMKNNPWEYKQHYKNQYEIQYNEYARRFIIDKLSILHTYDQHLNKFCEELDKRIELLETQQNAFNDNNDKFYDILENHKHLIIILIFTTVFQYLF